MYYVISLLNPSVNVASREVEEIINYLSKTLRVTFVV